MHDGEFPHEHYGDDIVALEKTHPLWRTDRVVLRSVGIDIGSSTSHLIFSTLEMRRQGTALSSRFELVKRTIDYASPILLTPFVRGASLDVPGLSRFFAAAYSESDLDAAAVDTGAVICTGDAARKDNAAAVVRMFSEQAGKFVCASAGPLLEAKMAAYGSGAVARSAADTALTVLNVDIGGGTTKLAIARGGRILETTAVNVGARLITFDDNDVVTKIETAAARVARHTGLPLRLGERADGSVRRALADSLAGVVTDIIARTALPNLTADLMIASPLQAAGPIDIVILSGGVSEYFYGNQTDTYGDIGPQLAEAFKARLSALLPHTKVDKPLQGIRATVIGASQFTAQVSGNTIHIGKHHLLPLRNLQVVTIDFAAPSPSAQGVVDAIRNALAEHEVVETEKPLALTFRWPHGPAFEGLNELCLGITRAMAKVVENRLPLIIILDADLARLVGRNLTERLNGYEDIICIDGVDLHDFDYIDIGQEHPDSQVVPVIVKSLIFTG